MKVDVCSFEVFISYKKIPVDIDLYKSFYSCGLSSCVVSGLCRNSIYVTQVIVRAWGVSNDMERLHLMYCKNSSDSIINVRTQFNGQLIERQLYAIIEGILYSSSVWPVWWTIFLSDFIYIYYYAIQLPFSHLYAVSVQFFFV